MDKGRRKSGEDLRQQRIVNPEDLMEEPGLTHSPFGDQEMEVGVEVYST
jgi:hypothetical protein